MTIGYLYRLARPSHSIAPLRVPLLNCRIPPQKRKDPFLDCGIPPQKRKDPTQPLNRCIPQQKRGRREKEEEEQGKKKAQGSTKASLTQNVMNAMGAHGNDSVQRHSNNSNMTRSLQSYG